VLEKPLELAGGARVAAWPLGHTPSASSKRLGHPPLRKGNSGVLTRTRRGGWWVCRGCGMVGTGSGFGSQEFVPAE